MRKLDSDIQYFAIISCLTRQNDDSVVFKYFHFDE